MPYLGSVGLDRENSSFIAGALPLATIIGRMGFGWMMDRVDKRGLAVLSFALNSLGVCILAFIAPGQTLLIVLFIIIYGVLHDLLCFTMFYYILLWLLVSGRIV